MACSSTRQGSFCRLGGSIRFNIVRYNWASLPALLCASPAVRTSLRDVLAHLRALALQWDDAVPELAETLVRETNLERIEIGDQAFILESLRTTDCLDLLLSEAQAVVLSPFLRHSKVLKRVRTSGRWLDVSCVQSLQAGAIVPLGSICNGSCILRYKPPTGTEICILSGLARRCAHDFQSLHKGRPWRDDVLENIALSSNPWHTPGLSVLARRGLAVAAKRCDVKFVVGHLPERAWRDQGQRPPWWLLMFLGLMVLMRQQENTHAKQTGFGGATLSTHPNRMYTFHERVHMGMMLTDGRSEGCPLEPQTSNHRPTSVTSSAEAVYAEDFANGDHEESVDVMNTLEL